MNNFLTWLAAAVLLLVGVLFALPPLIDWNQYRGVFEEEASRMLGREVRVSGKVDLRLLPVPFVQFEKIRIADAPGIPGSFVRADNFTLLLSVPPLLRGVIEARKLRIDKPVLRIRFDEKGHSNWQKIKLRAQDLPFIPADFALQSAEIQDGRIVVESHRGQVIAQVAGLSGELTASALRGPYRFNGEAVIADTELDVRLVTGVVDSTDAVVITTTATNENTGAKNYIEGRLSDLQTMPKFTGKFTVQAPVSVATSAVTAPARYDLRAKVSFDPMAAQLSDIEISIDSVGRPQQLKGHIEADWTEEFSMTGQLQSEWLDIDTITGGKTQNAAYRIFEILADSRTVNKKLADSTRIDLSVEQAIIAGETISEISARLFRSNGEIRVERLSANLPGQTKLRMNGGFPVSTNKYNWQGHTLVRGDNFKQFSEWLWPGESTVTGTAAHDFEFSGTIRSSPEEVEFSNAHINLAGYSSEGLLRYNWMQKPVLTLDWSADILDLSGFGDNILSNRNLAYLLGFGKSAADSGQPGQISEILRAANFDVRLQAQKVNDANRTFNDINLVLFRTDNKLQFGKSSFMIDPGLGLQFEGDFEQSPAGQHNWDLKGLISSNSAHAFTELSDFLELATQDFRIPKGLSVASPVNVAFSSQSHIVAGRRKNTFEANGNIHKDNLRLSIVTEGQIDRWRENDLRLDIKLDGKSIRSTARLLNGNPDNVAAASAEDVAEGVDDASAPVALPDQPFYLRFNLIGVAQRHLKASTALESQLWQLRMQADGKPDAEDDKSLMWTGAGTIQVVDLKSILASVAPDWARLFPASALSGGQFEFAGLHNGWKLEPADFKIAGSQMSGDLELVFAQTPRSRPSLTGSMTIDRINGAELSTAILLDEKPVPVPVPNSDTDTQAAPENIKKFWPDQMFDLAALDLLDVNVDVTAEYIDIAPGLNLQKARMNIASTSQSIALKIFDGELLGGKASGEMKVVGATFGTSVKTEIELKDAMIGSLVSADLSARAGGRVDFKLTATGQAPDPLALMTTLKGTGTAKLYDVRIPGLSPASLTEIADSIVIGERPPEELADRAEEALATGPLKLADQSVPLTLADGILTIGLLADDKNASALTNITTVDFLQLAINSQWQINTILQRSTEEPGFVPRPLPPARIIYAGTLAKLNEIEPNLNLGDLQRELTVQRMEHNVSRLERLRREDEERARQEQIERREAELERQKTLAEEAANREEEARQQLETQKPIPPSYDVQPYEPVITEPGSQSAQSPLPSPDQPGSASTTQPELTPPEPVPAPVPQPATPTQTWNPFISEN